MTDQLQTIDLLTLATEFRGDIVKQINRRTVGLRCIPMVRGDGKNIAWATELDGAHAESYSEGADATAFGGDQQSSAVLPWALYRSNVHVSSLAQDGAAGATTPAGNRSIWARQIINGAAKLATNLNTALFAGTGASNTLVGFAEAIAKDDNSYATVDRSQTASSYFRPTVVDPGSDTEVTIALLRDDQRVMYEASGEVADIALTTPTLFNAIGGLYDDTRRTVQQASGQGATTLNYGFQALELDGMQFLRDKDATTKTIFYVNTSHCRIEVLPGAKQKQMVDSMGVTPDDGFSAVPLDFVLEMLAKTGASDKAQMRWTGQFACDRPNTCGARKHAV